MKIPQLNFVIWSWSAKSEVQLKCRIHSWIAESEVEVQNLKCGIWSAESAVEERNLNLDLKEIFQGRVLEFFSISQVARAIPFIIVSLGETNLILTPPLRRRLLPSAEPHPLHFFQHFSVYVVLFHHLMSLHHIFFQFQQPRPLLLILKSVPRGTIKNGTALTTVSYRSSTCHAPSQAILIPVTLCHAPFYCQSHTISIPFSCQSPTILVSLKTGVGMVWNGNGTGMWQSETGMTKTRIGVRLVRDWYLTSWNHS